MSDLKPFISKVANGEKLSHNEAVQSFEIIMSGQATPSQIGGFLMALRMRGESVEEIAGAVSVIRDKMVRVSAPDDAMDIVGTGGTSTGTYSISTASVFVVAGCGVKIAKHGNRALSSKAGTADCLSALGLSMEHTPEQISTCIEQSGIGFMFAPAHHSAMRHVGPTRVELGTRTMFNVLGPLCNPAGVTKQLLGVYAPMWVEPLAHVLKDRGTTSAWVVHGDGLDELSTTGETKICQIKDDKVTEFVISPEDFGLKRVKLDALRGGNGEENAKSLRKMLEGDKNAYRDIVLLNSAAALVIADKAQDLHDGIAQASQSIDTGAALDRLDRLVATSQSLIAS